MKRTQKFMAMLVALLMLCTLLPTTASAANWQPTDTITINVRVFDQNTGHYYEVGTDTVTKGDQNIQSDAYQIPALTKFTDNSYGRVEKVAGNWYFPSGDSQPGTNVYWSCNSDTATMTYWVTNWSTGSGSGSTEGPNSGSEDLGGGSGSHSWIQTIVYHSNYPDGTDKTYTVTYNIRGHFVTTYNANLKTFAACSFTVPDGYIARERVWDTKQDGTGDSYANGGNFAFEKVNNGKTTHLYAQWDKDTSGGTPVEQVTLTFKDGSSTVAIQNYFSGDTATAIGYQKDGYTLKGWAADSAATDVTYTPGETFIINSNMILYAVWEQDVEEHQHKDDNGDGFCDEDGACMHDKDADGYCTVEGCEHPHDGTNPCCPLKPTTPVDPDDKISEPGMDKKAGGKDEIDDMKPGDTVDFTLNSHIGEDMADALEKDENGIPVQDDDGNYTGTYSLSFHDKMSENLEFNADSLAVKVGDTELTVDQFSLTVNPDDGCTFDVSIDCVALLNEGMFTYEELGTIAVVVSYSATVDADAADGDELKNEAWVNDSLHDVPPGDVVIPPEPPHTGGSGTTVFTVLGIALMCGAGVVLLANRKKKNSHN